MSQLPIHHHLLFIHREKGYLEQAAEAVGGDGFDVIIENASDINLGPDLTVIGPGARVVVRHIGWNSVYTFYLTSRFGISSFLFCFFRVGRWGDI